LRDQGLRILTFGYHCPLGIVHRVHLRYRPTSSQRALAERSHWRSSGLASWSRKRKTVSSHRRHRRLPMVFSRLERYHEPFTLDSGVSRCIGRVGAGLERCFCSPHYCMISGVPHDSVQGGLISVIQASFFSLQNLVSSVPRRTLLIEYTVLHSQHPEAHSPTFLPASVNHNSQPWSVNVCVCCKSPCTVPASRLRALT